MAPFSQILLHLLQCIDSDRLDEWMAWSHPFRCGIPGQEGFIKDYLLVLLSQLAIPSFMRLAYLPEASGNLSTRSVDMRSLLCLFSGLCRPGARPFRRVLLSPLEPGASLSPPQTCSGSQIGSAPSLPGPPECARSSLPEAVYVHLLDDAALDSIFRGDIGIHIPQHSLKLVSGRTSPRTLNTLPVFCGSRSFSICSILWKSF